MVYQIFNCRKFLIPLEFFLCFFYYFLIFLVIHRNGFLIFLIFFCVIFYFITFSFFLNPTEGVYIIISQQEMNIYNVEDKHGMIYSYL